MYNRLWFHGLCFFSDAAEGNQDQKPSQPDEKQRLADLEAQIQALTENHTREITKLRSELNDAISRRKKLAARLDELEQSGRVLSEEEKAAFDEFKKLREDQKTKKMIEEGRVNELLAEREQAVARAKDEVISNLKKELEKLQDGLKEKDKLIKRSLIHQRILSNPAIVEQTVLPPEAFVQLVENGVIRKAGRPVTFDLVEENGQLHVVGFEADDAGKPVNKIFSSRGPGYATVDEVIQMLISDDSMASMRRIKVGSGGTGAGTSDAKTGNATATGETVTRDQYQAFLKQYQNATPAERKTMKKRMDELFALEIAGKIV